MTSEREVNRIIRQLDAALVRAREMEERATAQRERVGPSPTYQEFERLTTKGEATA